MTSQAQSGEPPVEAAQTLGLDTSGDLIDVRLQGRWIVLRADQSTVHVMAVENGACCYTRCDHPREKASRAYNNPVEAIRAGLRRAKGS